MILSVKLCNSWMLCIFIWISINILNTESTCSFPVSWKDKAFKDSSNGSVTQNIHFYSGNVIWGITVYETEISLWNCHESSEKEIVIKSFTPITHNSQTMYAYQCLLFTDTTSDVFYYFPVREVTDGSRVVLSTDPNLSICDVCSSIEAELHTMSLQTSPSCDCTPPCSDLTATGTCSQVVDLSNVQCALPTTAVSTSTATTAGSTSSVITTSTFLPSSADTSNTVTMAGSTSSVITTTSSLPSSSDTSNTASKKSENVFTVEVIVILCASLLVLCLILVTSTVAIVIYNRNEQLKRQLLKIRKVRPAETA